MINQQQLEQNQQSQISVPRQEQQPRARSTNAKASQNVTLKQANLNLNAGHTPWTPDRTQNLIVKSSAQQQKKTNIGTTINPSNSQRSMTQRISNRTIDASPGQRPFSGLHSHQNSGVNSSRTAQEGDSYQQLQQSKLIQNSSKNSLNLTQARESTRNSAGIPAPQASNRSSSASFVNASGTQQVQRSHMPSKELSHTQSQNFIVKSGLSSAQQTPSGSSHLQEKITLLKNENKKLMKIMRNSEKLFYEKLKEAKRESENLSAVFKQVWPLIKSKVKDPNALIKNIVSGDGQSAKVFTDLNAENEEKDHLIEDLQNQVTILKQSMAQLSEELKDERQSKKDLQVKWHRQNIKIMEMRAFQQTVQTHTTTSSNEKQGQVDQKQKNAMPHTLESQKSDLPVPSFLKALYISSWDTIFDEDYQDQGQLSLGYSNTTSANASNNDHSRGFKSDNQEQQMQLSAPEALKLRMHELTSRSKSGLGVQPQPESKGQGKLTQAQSMQDLNLQKAKTLNFTGLFKGQQHGARAPFDQGNTTDRQRDKSANVDSQAKVIPHFLKKQVREKSQQPVNSESNLLIQNRNSGTKQQAYNAQEVKKKSFFQQSNQ